MINKVVCSLMLICFSVAGAFSQSCVPCFTATPDSSNPLVINLDASCSNASSSAIYDWYMDGLPIGVMNQPIFQIPFYQGGSYTITLLLNDGTCYDSVSQNINIQAGCNASFINYTVTPSSQYFYHLGIYSNTASYQWDFGDGNTGSGPSVLHTYTATGTYPVCLTITDSSCTDVSCQNITITSTNPSSCVASFVPYVDTLLGMLYADASSSSYDPFNTYFSWYLNGSLLQQSASPYFNAPFLIPGTYTLSLVLSDTSLNSCDSTTQVIVYNNSLPNSSCFSCFNYSYNATYDSVYLTSCSIVPNNGSILWYVNGNTFAGGNGPFLQGFANYGYQTVGIYVLDSLNMVCDSFFQYVYTYQPPCTSCLTVTPVAGSTSDYIFDGSCSALNYAYNWYVNGNYIATSYSNTFTYSFNQSGNYQVCVESMDSIGNYCSQNCTSVTVNTPTSTVFDLAGRIYKYDNTFQYVPVTQGEAKVYLIKLITGGILDAVDSTISDANGYYSFQNKPIDDYRVKVALNPSSPDYAINIPTYYNSGIMWYDANVITLFSNLYSRDVYMQYGINNGGNGFISGSVFQGANKGGKTRSGSAQDVTLILIDLATNEPIAYTKPNASGNYSFSNIPNGSYKVYGELLNRASIPDNIVISATQNVFANKNFMYSNTLIQPTNQALSVNEIPTLSDVMISPNPAKQSCTIQNDEVARQVTVLDITGRFVESFDLKSGEKKLLDCSSWKAGIYMIQSNANGRTKTTKLLVQ